jgi:hypothetical protein
MREQIGDLRDQLQQAHTDKDKIMKMMEDQISTVRLLSDQRPEKKTEEVKGFWARLLA